MFIRKIGITTSFVAELWALRDGLSMCVDMQIPALEVELDAKVVADLMNNTTSLNADYAVYAVIVANCRQLLKALSVSLMSNPKVLYLFYQYIGHLTSL